MKNIILPFIASCVLVLSTPCPGSGTGIGLASNSSTHSLASDSVSGSTDILITGIYFDPFLLGEASEAIQIQNVGENAVSVSGWSLSDDHGTVYFPPGATLAAHQKLWASKSAFAFRSEFGFSPAYEYGADSDPAVPEMNGTALTLANSGDVVILKNDQSETVDAVPYAGATLAPPAWNGPSVKPYSITGGSTEGQIIFRKMREIDGLPATDTDMVGDWAQDGADSNLGKRVQYPGWDVDEFFQIERATEYAQVKYCVAPDNLFQCYRDEILAARDTVRIETYSYDQAGLVDALTRQIAVGVQVSLLLDGGALDDQGKWACRQIELQGGQCWLMDHKPQANIAKRYSSLHGKWTIIDGKRLIVGSENVGDDAMPSDDKRDGTFGVRGGDLITDSPLFVAGAQAIINADFDPARHSDIRRWGTSANDYPPLGFVPNYVNGGNTYPVRFPNPFVLSGTFSFELVQCPENCLRASDALFGMIARAGSGDRLLVEQLYERKFWGEGASSTAANPNLRLEAYIGAARRGAHVQILLDSFYDTFSNARSNYETCRYVNQLSRYYSIECRLGNPTGRGIHNKMVLLKHGATGFVHLGSINGSETSSKLNRELAVQVESPSAYGYWEKVFDYDWSVSTLAPRQIFLPIIFTR